MLRESLRRIPTKSLVEPLFNTVLQSSQDETVIQMTQCIKTYAQQKETVDSSLISDAVRRWALEQPKKVALLTGEMNQNACTKFTFADLQSQSSRFANVLTGKDFELTSGNSVLVVLPNSAPEHIFLQLACSQSGLVYCPYDPENISGMGLTERIQKLSVDCVITDESRLELVREYTHNPLRPLKKGLITNCSSSQPLPVGWNHLIQRATEANSEFADSDAFRSNSPAVRFLSNTNQLVQYSQKSLNVHLLLVALWMNLEKRSQLVWMKNFNNTISIAPWLFGTSIFIKPTKDLQTLLETLEKHPIDTFCSSSTNYQLLTHEQPKKSTQLTQLLSTEHVDLQCLERWHSLTNLHIRDNYQEFTDQSVLKSSTSSIQSRPLPNNNIKFSLGPAVVSKKIPLKKFLYQYSSNQDRRQENRV